MEQDGIFSQVNDSIRKLAGQGPPAQTWEFICECDQLSCHELVSLTLSEFDSYRTASPPLRVLALRHAA